MKALMITGSSSNSGKTTISLGLARAIKNRGYNISAFKTGPDYIDLKYLGIASGKKAGNLDFHLMGQEGLGQALAMNKGDFAIIEGAMGYFDGIYNTFENSAYYISKDLNISAVLVYSPKGEMFTAIPKIKGLVEFEDSKIKGLILNRVSEPMFKMLKEIIEKYIDIEVLGYLPNEESLELDSRYLGLALPEENSNVEDLIDKLGLLIEKTIDIDRLLNLAKDLTIPGEKIHKKRDISVAIALDKAFNFYYKENLRLLESTCQVTYFSPIEDKILPKADLIYIGGGYPELYIDDLEANIEMRNQIKNFAQAGGHIFAEGGGLMYLFTSIEDKSMVNIFEGSCKMTNRLQNFGYVNIKLNEDTILGKSGQILSGHEFHRSIIETHEKTIFSIQKPKNLNRKWECGYKYKNVLGSYQHINFLGNMDSFNYLLDKIQEKVD